MFGLTCIMLWILASLRGKDYNRGRIIKQARFMQWCEQNQEFERNEVGPLIEYNMRHNREAANQMEDR